MNEFSDVIDTVQSQSARVLETYQVDSGLVQEHANNELRITQGGYGDRQLFELVQNGADEIGNEAEGRGKLAVVLTDDTLYCANTGTPVTAGGAETILRMSVSRKRNKQIGRFGVGIKSVLSVSDAPQFFSTTGCFGFDRAWSAAQIGEALQVEGPVTFDTPVLRMARELDREIECAEDAVLRELLGWATTVVRLPLLPGAAERLGYDISGHRYTDGRRVDAFPAGFQIFSSHVGEVLLEDRRPSPVVRRTLTVRSEGSQRIIRELRSGAKEATSVWRVHSIEHRPTEAAAGSAGELHDRSTIDISWAVPEYTPKDGLLSVHTGRGEFWSFFPTKYPVSLTGYLNAAWKTNEDRQNLLDGSAFNRELLQVSARLVVTSLPRLAPAEDPGAYLALLPQRVKEATNWAEEFLLRNIWQAAAQIPSLPDQDGTLRVPRDLKIHPDKLGPDLLNLWAAYPGRPRDWVHPSTEATPLRRGKMGFILDEAKHEPQSVKTWLEALVTDGTAEASCHAIGILSAMVANDERGPLTVEARRARIVLTEEHGLVAPVAGKIFDRTGDDELRDDMVYVDSRISDKPEMGRHLHAIGIRIADAQGRFEGILDQGFEHYTGHHWMQFWQLLRSAGGAAQVNRIRAKVPDPLETLRVRTLDGRFHVMRDCLIPGPVVPEDGSRDALIAVDMDFHAEDRPVFRELGLLDRPTGGHRPEPEGWFADFHKAVYDAYCRTLGASERRVNPTTLRLEGSAVAGPLHLFPRLSKEGRAAFIAAVPDEALIENWTRQVGRNADTRNPIASPIRWLLRRHGFVNSSQGLVSLRDAVGPQLKEYADVLPVAEISGEKARKLHLPTRADQVPAARWKNLLDLVLASTDDEFVGRAYALLLRVEFDFSAVAVEFTRCRIGAEWGLRADDEIAVATSRGDYDELVREQLPALLVADKRDAETARAMVETWGMRKVSDVITKNVRKVTTGAPVLLVEEYPPLRQRLRQSDHSRKVQYCSELEQNIRTPQGSRLDPLDRVRQGSTLLLRDTFDPLSTLEAADDEFGWGLGAQGCAQILARKQSQQQNVQIQERLRKVSEAESVIDKIALLIDTEQLRSELPAGLLESEVEERGEEPDARRIAEMAFNAHGEGILHTHSKDLAAAFPGHAPTTFAGNSKELKFCAGLGFPDSFAGARIPTLRPRFEVEGPKEFPALHDYQEQLATALQELLNSPTPKRGMLSIPTGAGKTRVTSEAVIRWIRKLGELPGPVLWIAQTEELCEQAVQSWSFVWSKVGAEMPLVVSRLWTTNQASPVAERPHLVVATDAKLDSCLSADDYAWLRSAALVIVDEAHGAIAPRYTRILERLGLTAQRTRCPLVGLTATPYRNDEDLTRRLVQRFGERLDLDVFGGDQIEAIKQLQEIGVLAQVRHRELMGGQIKLTVDELRESEKFGGTLPRAAEQRLADDHERNQRLVDEITNMPADWPVLVFATSVAHAKFLAAKLGDRGVRASAIDSATPTAQRQKRIKDFREGRTQVLTNYGVLTQGFDAPATRAVVVARPTYSPNIYQQMIGRGLRGPKNGGKDTCLILNVRDNIDNYREDLAFTAFDYLWGEER